MGTFVLRSTAIALCGLAATWLGMGAEQVCPAIYPAPESCGAGARTTPAAVGTGVITAILALSIVVAALRNTRVIRVMMVTLLGATSTVTPIWTLFAGGFAADERVLTIALLILLIIAMTLAATRAPRKERGERL
ncbi:hypothetical protein [Curtobacterium sp. NPDC089185]|uniref:hypothetical protein n=1 Tax=Curtobacterium sp. NPDC089185 TaxID=3154968 RepID=UPI0034125B7D